MKICLAPVSLKNHATFLSIRWVLELFFDFITLSQKNIRQWVDEKMNPSPLSVLRPLELKITVRRKNDKGSKTSTRGEKESDWQKANFFISFPLCHFSFGIRGFFTAVAFVVDVSWPENQQNFTRIHFALFPDAI